MKNGNHKLVIFVGDKPSKKNVNPLIPFVGTQSYKRLLDWIWQMDMDINFVEMVNIEHMGVEYQDRYDRGVVFSDGRHYCPDDVQFIALGNNASKHLKDLKLDHFKLPHPSGRNFQINNPNFIRKKLMECKRWLT